MKFSERLNGLGFKTYDDYLSSKHWEEFKEKYRSSKRLMRCAVCGHGKIQLHHHNYQRLGAESLDDVTPLCGLHHEHVHFILKTEGWFVDKTAKAIEMIRSMMPTQKIHQNKKQPKHRNKNHGKRTLKKRFETSTPDMISEFCILRDEGYRNPCIPANYDPSCNDGQLPRFLKILRRAKNKLRRLARTAGEVEYRKRRRLGLSHFQASHHKKITEERATLTVQEI